jgi:hypothetical protein
MMKTDSLDCCHRKRRALAGAYGIFLGEISINTWGKQWLIHECIREINAFNVRFQLWNV